MPGIHTKNINVHHYIDYLVISIDGHIMTRWSLADYMISYTVHYYIYYLLKLILITEYYMIYIFIIINTYEWVSSIRYNTF